MSETDRKLDDIEKRLARLERIVERKPLPAPEEEKGKTWALHIKSRIAGWCECGRDVCRAPDCPMGRERFGWG
jgi:hypothetical protein